MCLSWNESEHKNESYDAHSSEGSVASRLNLEFGPPDAWGFICPTCRGFVPLCYNNGPVRSTEPRPEIPGPVALCCPTCRGGDLFTPADLCLGHTPVRHEPPLVD